MKYLFGPVPSRRLGVSLGVDLVPRKFCSLDCLYCEIGKTTDLTAVREEYLPADEIIRELDSYLSDSPELDFITFSGQGEPTLNSGIGRIINFIKADYPQYKIAVITNGTLFADPEVRKELAKADYVLPSLDAISEDVFRKINRPTPELDIKAIIEGLKAFAREYTGILNLEIFLLPGINDTKEELGLLKEAAEEINPSLIQLNTLDRPGTSPDITAEKAEKMEETAEFFRPLPVEIIAKFKSRKKLNSYDADIESKIVATIGRRPCTDTELADITGLHINELNKYLSEMLASGKIETVEKERGRFFKIKDES